MKIPLADYQEQIEAFAALFQPDHERRILLFRGQSGTGKTTLLSACKQSIPAGIHHIPIQLRGRAVGVPEIFSRTGGALGWDRWPRFTQQVADFTGTPKVGIDRNWLAGINNRISVALHAESPVDRAQRRVGLTEAWFDDVRVFDQPLLVMLDTYEQAPAEVSEWISGPFLARAVHCQRLRVVVAGREVPDAHNIEWGHCCAAQILRGVREAKYWLPVVEALGLVVPAKHPLDYLAGVCRAFDGRPDEIKKCIMDFPSRRPEAVL